MFSLNNTHKLHDIIQGIMYDNDFIIILSSLTLRFLRYL